MSTDKNKLSKAYEIFSEYLVLHHKRRTPERFAMLECAVNFEGRFTIDDFHSKLDETGFHVSLATVYNNLQLLVDCDLIRRYVVNSNHNVYESICSPANHLYLVCTKCGKVKSFADQHIANQIADKRFASFTPAYYTLNIYGLCRTCLKRQRQVNKNKKEITKQTSSISNHKK